MSVPINRLPWGLLGFLGIKNGGEYPQTLAQQLVPVWDLKELYLEGASVLAGTASTVGATGYVAHLSPPPGEVWQVYDFQIVAACGAGEAFTGALCRSRTSGGTTVNVSDTFSVAASTTGCKVTQRPFILTAGENMGLITYAVTGTVDLYVSARYTVLQT